MKQNDLTCFNSHQWASEAVPWRWTTVPNCFPRGPHWSHSNEKKLHLIGCLRFFSRATTCVIVLLIPDVPVTLTCTVLTDSVMPLGMNSSPVTEAMWRRALQPKLYTPHCSPSTPHENTLLLFHIFDESARESQSRPSWSPSPLVAHADWMNH